MTRTSRLFCTIFALYYFCVSAQDESNEPLSPRIPTSYHRGLMIDAGSGGSRIHIFSWEPPTDGEIWSTRGNSGISNCDANSSAMASCVRDHLHGLLSFAKEHLHQFRERWKYYPVYFKATGGMRQLPYAEREAIMNTLRGLLADKSFCPFLFRAEFARVISGEEEAVYSWTATNYLMGTLIPESEGYGTALPAGKTFGTVDMGGASTQIAFFVPSQDISEGLFKLQIGSQRHWNVYSKSYLTYGHNSARERYFLSIADNVKVDPSSAVVPSALDYCLFAGYSENFSQSGDRGYEVNIYGPAVPASDQLERCRKSITPLLNKPFNALCHRIYGIECSFAGQYQPVLPTGEHGNFMGTASLKYPWQFLKLPQTATIQDFYDKAKTICSMSFNDIVLYDAGLTDLITKEKHEEMVPYYCFITSYVFVLLTGKNHLHLWMMLIDGFGFQLNQTLTVTDTLNGHKVGWALGSMLYEINTLPWDLAHTKDKNNWAEIWSALLAGVIVGILLSVVLAKKVCAHVRYVPAQQQYSAVEVNSSAWANHISQFNPFSKRKQYDAIPTNADAVI